jgi:sulfofructose kinase
MTDRSMNFHASAPKIPPRILCIGIPVRDLTFRVRGVPARGSKENATHFEEICGGNALNAAIGIVRLGGRASVCGPMGDARETPSRYIFDKLAHEGIDSRHLVHMPGLVTPISTIMIDPSGERTIVTFRDPELWKVQLPHPEMLLEDCAAILTESRCAEFCTDLCAEARRRDIPVIVDVDRAMSLREGLLTASSHLVFSSEPLQETADVADDGAALKKIAKLTPSFLAGTRGPQGTIWLDDHGHLQETPAFPVHTVDTLGAGDVFHGAFALAITEKQELRQALRFASAAAALKCTRFGGAFAAPQRAEVEKLLDQNQGTRPVQTSQKRLALEDFSIYEVCNLQIWKFLLMSDLAVQLPDAGRRLDAIDRKILTVLQEDASLSVAEIGDRVGLSSTPCWKRIQRLEADGVILRRVALVDQNKIGLGISVFVSVESADHSEAWLRKFADAVSAMPEVMEFYRMAGDVDYMLRVVCADMASYDVFYKKLIAAVPLKNVTSRFAMEKIKSVTALPVPAA